MVTLPFRVEEFTADDLNRLIDAEASEGVSLEFKSEPYRHDHDGKREFLKDVTSMANTAGGVLLIGMTEERGTAKAIAPITDGEPDKMKLRLESLLQDAVELRIFGVTMHAIHVPSGYVVAIRVPRSSNVPHRVTLQNSNRFFLRSSAGGYEASMEELRRLFSETAAIRERVTGFRDERLTAILNGKGSYPLSAADCLIMHIVPLSSLGVRQTINIPSVHENFQAFRPMGDLAGFSPKFNVDGFANTTGSPPYQAYTQVFRSGVMEAVAVGIIGQVRGKRVLPGRRVQTHLFESLPRYIEGLRAAHVSPPLFVAVSLVGLGGVAMWGGNHAPNFDSELPAPLTEPTLKLPICVIEDYGHKSVYQNSLKDALDALWNAGDRSEWTLTG